VGQIFVGIIFAVVLAPDYGLLNRFLQALVGWGLEIRWLENPSTVMPAIVITNLWLYAGFNMNLLPRRAPERGPAPRRGRRASTRRPLEGVLAHHASCDQPVAIFVLLISTIGSFQLFELPYA